MEVITDVHEEHLKPAPVETNKEFVVAEAIKKYLLHMSKNNVESLRLLGYMTDSYEVTIHALSLKDVAFSKKYEVSQTSVLDSLFKD